MGSSEEKRKHGEILPNTIRAIICGPSNCSKTNVLISLLESPNGVRFGNVIYSKSTRKLQQPKYQYLENLFYIYRRNQLLYVLQQQRCHFTERGALKFYFIFDDISCDKQDAVREYFSSATRMLTAFISVRREDT